MVPARVEWRGETDNRATPPVGYSPSTASFSVRPYCKNARRDRCQEYHNCFTFGELEETTRTSSNYVDEDYPARPEIKQSLLGWGDNCGSELSILATDVCVWRCAPLVVLATQEEEDSAFISSKIWSFFMINILVFMSTLSMHAKKRLESFFFLSTSIPRRHVIYTLY